MELIVSRPQPHTGPREAVTFNPASEDYQDSVNRALADLIAFRREHGFSEDPWAPMVMLSERAS